MEVKLGATGRFPAGKLGEHDEGELRFAVAADKARGVLVVDFGTRVRSLGLPKDDAIKLGTLLIERAKEL